MTEEQLNRACGVAPNDMPVETKYRNPLTVKEIGKYFEFQEVLKWSSDNAIDIWRSGGQWCVKIRDSETSCDQTGETLYQAIYNGWAHRKEINHHNLLPGLHEALRLAHVAEDSDLVVGRIMKRISELEGGVK